jgi:endoglycosylceramidase
LAASVAGAAAVTGLSACSSGPGPARSANDATIPPGSALSTANPATGPVGPLAAPGGPFLVDRYGRVAFLHGVNLVDKLAPYEVVVTGSGPNVLTTAAVQRMQTLGFDVVRLGILWRGLEPGTDPVDDTAICRPGHPGAAGPDQFDAAVFDRYLARLDATVALLGRYGISSLIDMHQDVYSEVFGGEGAPNWAVCTDGATPRPKRNIPNWSDNLQGPGVAAAYAHFWHNDVVGDLQGAFDAVWARVATHFRDNPWVVGYDPFNEPYAQGLPPYGFTPAFDAELQCFYMGRADPGTDQQGRAITCPAGDPGTGVIPRIEAADPHHLVFYEPNYTTDSGVPSHIGPMSAPRLVLNFHDYCFLHVPNGPEPPSYGQVCGPLERNIFTVRAGERGRDATPQQPGGPAWMLTEFGATTDAADLARVTADANGALSGWIYWQWIRYDDPTGSHTSGLWPPDAATEPLETTLAQPYAEAVAGTPTSMGFDPVTGAFTVRYRADPHIHQPTVVFVPVAEQYPGGYCARAVGARITSRPGAPHLDVTADEGPPGGPAPDTVTVSVTRGAC